MLRKYRNKVSSNGHKPTAIFFAIGFMVALCLPLAFPARGDDAGWDKRSVIRKAEVVAMHSAIAMAENRSDEFLYLIDYAYDLDSTDIDIAAKWGIAHLYTQNTDSVKFEKAYSKIKKRFLACPEDYNESLRFAALTQKLHRFDDEVMAWKTIDSLNPSKTDPAIYLANAYMHKYILGDTASFQKAIDIFNRIESGVGADMGLSSMKIRAFAVKKDTAAIINELCRLHTSAPSDPNISLFLGDNYNMLQMPDSAILYLNKACELDSTNGSAYLARAEFFINNGDSVAYDREVFRALKSPNLEYESKFSILKNYISTLYSNPDQQDRIEDLFAVLEDLHPGESTLHMLYGYYLFALKNEKRAAEQFGYASALDPADDEAWEAQLHMYSLINDYENIYKVANNAISRFPDNLYYPIMAANALIQKDDDYLGALNVLNSVKIKEVNNAPGVSKFVSFKANIYSNMDSIPQAYKYYEEALKIDPENYMAMNNYAYLMAVNNGNLDLAERLSNLALKSAPESTTFIDTYAWVQFKRKDYPSAKKYIDKILCRIDWINEIPDFLTDIDTKTDIKTDAPAHNINRDSDERDENSEDDNQLNNELEDSEQISEIYEHAGDIYFMNGEPHKALILWKKALEIDSDSEILRRKVKNKTYFYE